jgi:hypothetical protein
MIPIPALILCVVFLILSAIHVRWLSGDHMDLDGVVPAQDGKPLFQPGKTSTLLVAVALALAAVVSVWRGLYPLVGPAWIPRLGIWVLAAVFALRAIGDFRYIGIFKRVRGTKFARNDSLFFSPLCMVISALAIWLALGY